MTLQSGEDAPMIAGGAAQPVAMLGDSFADLAQGTVQPAVTEATAERVAAMTRSLAQTRAIETPAVQPKSASPVHVVPPEKPGHILIPAPATPAQTTALPQYTEAVRPETVLSALPEITHAPEASVRPAIRPDRQQMTSEAAKRPQASGNAERSAKRGTTDGQRAARAATAAPRADVQTTARANAAASNYPGRVLRKISRVRAPRIQANGAAIIRLSITDSGALSDLSVAQSSGNVRLDEAALKLIINAAPFPPPPEGARRSFSVEVKGRQQ
ncbi:TonB family protein [Aestuariivita boseongensis]|uniref:TonB family protein n=1 Tax=Aestuariivita boseongensis TaxID=1470562 RepID=UPI00155DB05F|nr:TonB family protein [Aestuariivita boseongensis]